MLIVPDFLLLSSPFLEAEQKLLFKFKQIFSHLADSFCTEVYCGHVLPQCNLPSVRIASIDIAHPVSSTISTQGKLTKDKYNSINRNASTFGQYIAFASSSF